MHQLPPSIEATNFVQMIRKEGSVKGTWIIDPTLVIPPALLPPLPDGAAEGDRKNLHLQSKEGSVYGDVYIKPTSYEVLSTMKRSGKISIYGMSKEGKVELKIVSHTRFFTPCFWLMVTRLSMKFSPTFKLVRSVYLSVSRSTQRKGMFESMSLAPSVDHSLLLPDRLARVALFCRLGFVHSYPHFPRI